MKLAYTMAPGRGDTDLILHKLAADLGACGLRCCGTVQITSVRADSGPCDMDVQLSIIHISQPPPSRPPRQPPPPFTPPCPAISPNGA